ncbi:MAG: phosphoenolpyruvate--protein phosphotransferase [Candidatus Eutrophobiaceae bacterium]
MSLSLHGLGVSPGVAIGKARLLKSSNFIVDQHKIEARQVTAELRRLNDAVASAHKILDETRRNLPKHIGTHILDFIDAHILILEDKTLVEETKSIIGDRLLNAEWALRMTQENWNRIFAAINDPYIAARRADVAQVIDRIMQSLTSSSEQISPGISLQGYIVIAEDMGPAEVVSFHNHKVAALATAHGGITSHAAILAKSLQIPMVVGLHDVSLYLQDEEPLILDGGGGMLLAEPDENTLKFYRARIRERRKFLDSLDELRQKPTRTLDCKHIRLLANIELHGDCSSVQRMKADGVGLYRTESLYMNRDAPPSEDEHFRAYMDAARALRGKPLTIRTADITLNSSASEWSVGGTGAEAALGLRAIRLCLRDLGIFKPQLRAVLRASALAPVRVMLPLLTDFSELQQVRALLDTLRSEMDASGESYDANLLIGAMIEVPAAALCADLFARELDFMMIGTNDLMQYTLAIDRANEEVSYLYDPLHPAILRLISTVIDAGKKCGIPVGMCGELANEPRFVRLLLALGLREFSVSPTRLLEIRQIINSSRLVDTARFRSRIIHTRKTESLQAIVEQLNGLEPALPI